MPRRTDGFSDDGLSYSVATDFDKQLGQALAEMEARTKGARYVPGAAVERPDAPDVLANELLDPIMQARSIYEGNAAGGFGERDAYRGRDRKDVAPRNSFRPIVRKDGSIAVMDLVTGDVKEGPAAPIKPPTDLIPKNASQTSNWFQNSPTMQAEESEAIAKINQPGADIVDILGAQHPTLLQNPPYATRFGPMYRGAMSKRGRDAAGKVDPANVNVAGVMAERKKLADSLLQEDLPDETMLAIKERMAQIDDSLRTRPAAPDGEELVEVYNPKGVQTRIRKSNLDNAVKNLGYRLK